MMEIIRLVFSPIEVNTYILIDESGDCAVIDCGCYNKAEEKELTGIIENRKLNVSLLLNTHCHLDHVFGNGFILEKYGIRTLSCEYEEVNRRGAVLHAMFFGLDMEEPPEPAGFIADNEVVTFGTTDLTAIHVPGHSPGSLAFYNEEKGCVITGDALFAGSIGRSDLPGGDHLTLIRSIKERLFSLPPSTIVYPGHGDPTTIGEEIISNPYF